MMKRDPEYHAIVEALEDAMRESERAERYIDITDRAFNIGALILAVVALVAVAVIESQS